MILFNSAAAVLILLAAAAGAAPPVSPAGAAPAVKQLTGFPFTDETLNYSVNWPSGLSLGEGHFTARRAGSDWNFDFSLDAGIPGYPIRDSYLANASGDFCSAIFNRSSEHGSRRTDEKESVDLQRSTVTRVTVKGGGESTFPVPACVRDALTFLYFTRRELGQGRVPPSQEILFGRLYQARLDYAGAQVVPIGGKGVETDKILVTMKSPSSEVKFEMYFARDPARTPLLFRTRLAMGPFSMELMR